MVSTALIFEDGVGVDRERVGVQDDQVGQLAGFDGALLVFLADLPGGLDRQRLERLPAVDTLARADDLAFARLAGDWMTT